LDRVEGRKYVILISTGCDSFSKLTWDKIQNKLKNTRDITIFTVGTGQAMRLYYESQNALRYLPCTGANFEEGAVQMDFLQADNQMNTIARMTGGRSYAPRFAAGFPDAFQDIAATIRNEYSIAYHPTNTKQDGSWRKIKVELQAPDGGPLTVKDQHGKNIKFQVVARDGYRAKNIVE
jgi:VWFA-related protein